MANRSNIVIDNKLNMGGLTVIADDVTMDDGAVLTITFPAYTIFTVMVNYTGTSITKAKSVSSGLGTVTLTASGDGTVSFIIIASTNTTVSTPLDIGTDATYTLTPVRA